MTHRKPHLLLGVDTGGTYTDAVVLDAGTLAVTASAKALTTRHDLAIGVSDALMAISESFEPEQISLVSVSTTLATNAVVEGHGSPILVFLVGFDEAMVERTGISEAFRDAVVVRIDGGHDHFGVEAAPLDREAIGVALDAHQGAVRAVAVAATFAVRNPTHEHTIRDVVVENTDLPVTISSSLSESLDAPRRALTTALNARLLSRVTDLLDAVRRSLEVIGIDAPVMVAKGDGSLAAADSVAQRPIETILSGPAASIVGAAALTGLADFVLSDVGGTTTDVGRLRAGRPLLVPDGARVGGWRTMVNAIDVRTTGVGGDSEVVADRATIVVGPQRRIPISLLALEHPGIIDQLRLDLDEPPPRDFASGFVVAVGDPSTGAGLSSVEQRLVDRIGDGPTPLQRVAATGLEQRSLASLVEKGIVQSAGFTPSDAAHVLGLQDNWSGDGALAAAALMAWYTEEDATEFSDRVWSETVRRSAACVLEVALSDSAGPVLANPVLDAVISGVGTVGGVGVQLQPFDPFVAVGGPARVFYPEVAKRCGAQLVVPEQFFVANAVGAAAGHVVARSHAEVHSDGPAQFRVVTSRGAESATDASEALVRAEQRAHEIASEYLRDRSVGLERHGAVLMHVDLERHDAPDSRGDDGLYWARVDVEVRVRPVSTRGDTVNS